MQFLNYIVVSTQTNRVYSEIRKRFLLQPHYSGYCILHLLQFYRVFMRFLLQNLIQNPLQRPKTLLICLRPKSFSSRFSKEMSRTIIYQNPQSMVLIPIVTQKVRMVIEILDTLNRVNTRQLIQTRRKRRLRSGMAPTVALRAVASKIAEFIVVCICERIRVAPFFNFIG